MESIPLVLTDPTCWRNSFANPSSDPLREALRLAAGSGRPAVRDGALINSYKGTNFRSRPVGEYQGADRRVAPYAIMLADLKPSRSSSRSSHFQATRSRSPARRRSSCSSIPTSREHFGLMSGVSRQQPTESKDGLPTPDARRCRVSTCSNASSRNSAIGYSRR